MSASRVAVVGAGIAGLAAARRLKRAGVDVTVFDKARGVGGRTATRRTEWGGFDHGAQYFTRRHERFARQVDDWLARGVAAPWAGKIVSLREGRTTPASDGSERIVGVPGMSAPARDLASGLRVECGHAVAELGRGPESWRLVMADERVAGDFDAVLVSAPAPQASALLAPAPELAERARAVVLQPCFALMLAFPRPLGAGFAGAFVEHPALAWVACEATRPGRAEGERWVLHGDPRWSEAQLESPADEVAQVLLHAFAKALGRELPTPALQALHRWRFARTREALGSGSLWDPVRRIGACGDWLLGARVEDAYLSGSAAAEAILAA